MDKAAGPAEPPVRADKKHMTADELWEGLNRHPLFMTQLDETDGADGQNDHLEALRQLAYEGTRAEVSLNFKTQGNECVAEKRWADAREFYTKGILTARGLIDVHDAPDDPEVKITEDPDPLQESQRERLLEEQCLVNRALCNLEMKNYGSCNRDCAAVLNLNPQNSKAWYRAASACLALDKNEEALDACEGGLRYDPQNTALQALKTKAEARRNTLETLQRDRQARQDREARESAALKLALRSRNISTRQTPHPPNMEDAAASLADPLDPASTLSLPLVLLYPLEAQSDFVKACRETESVGEHLSYILPTPWDEKGQYTPEAVECYMETREGGLIKVGKKMSLLRFLSSGKVDVLDGMVSVLVVPKTMAAQFIDEFKKRKGKA